MKRSTERVLTTHAGSLPRPLALQNVIKTYLDGQSYEEVELTGQIQSAVAEVVRQQADAGVDIPSDGEQSKTGFLLYGNDRLSGFELVLIQPGERPRARRRDEETFSDSMPNISKQRETRDREGSRCAPVRSHIRVMR